MERLGTLAGCDDVATLVASAVGIGLSVGSWSATRDDSYFGSFLLVPAVPVVVALAALVLAVVFRGRSLRPLPVLAVAAGLVLVQLLAIPLASFWSASEGYVFGILITVAEGVASALLTYVFLASLTRFSPRQIAVTIAGGYLLVHLYDGLFFGMGKAVRLAQRPVALVAMVLIAAVLLRRQRRLGGEGGRAVVPESGAAPVAIDPVRSGRAAGYVPLACLVCVLLLVQGVYSQLTGLGSMGNIQAFNLFTELFAAGVRGAVLVYCLLRADAVPPSHVATCAAAIFLVGIPVVALSWGTDAYLVGSHIINSARYALLPLVMIVGVQAARRCPDDAASLILMMMAVANSCYLSRLVAGMVLGSPSEVGAVLPAVSFGSMWVVACAVPLCMLAKERLDRDVRPVAGGDVSGAAPDVVREWAAADPALWREIQFYRRLEGLCEKARLTEREREILHEVLHGYSIDSIAGRLNLSVSTVKTYLSRAYARFDVSSRQAVLDLRDSEPEQAEAAPAGPAGAPR